MQKRWEHPCMKQGLRQEALRLAVQLAAGYAAVWATDNTREAIWDAIAAQGGLRHLRLAHYAALLRRLGLHHRRTSRTATSRGSGYQKGVPMGGDLDESASAGKKAPTFLVAGDEGSAVRQPRPPPDREGLARQGRQGTGKASTTSPGAMRTGANSSRTASCRRVGNTVDVATATWTNTIGDPELGGRLEGPGLRPVAACVLLRARDRDPDTALDGCTTHVRFGVKMSPEVPMTQQERAWSSPIWYTPGG